eukprot:6479993-Amphidinium_carterae.2
MSNQLETAGQDSLDDCLEQLQSYIGMLKNFLDAGKGAGKGKAAEKKRKAADQPEEGDVKKLKGEGETGDQEDEKDVETGDQPAEEDEKKAEETGDQAAEEEKKDAESGDQDAEEEEKKEDSDERDDELEVGELPAVADIYATLPARQEDAESQED